ncbi:unnamed protein product [Prorocentrum cordatum]|uniref:GATA-type domain-containing protein n=1 Tax=Prorocentrum cordatum TaxID=2364126 RepID=A0ABN9SN14_9DINO|nr:unnamed protein product [Polarella glacialis]
MAPRRVAADEPWICKSCVHSVTGKPWFNAGGTLYCKQCQLHKSVVFKEYKRGKTPSVHAAGTKGPSSVDKGLAARCAQLEEQIKRVTSEKAEPTPPPPWAQSQPDGAEDKRKRIKELDGIIRMLSPDKDATVLANFKKEKETLDRELFDGRPIEDQARSLAAKLQHARSQESSVRKSVEEQRAKIQELQGHLDKAEAKLVEASAEVVRLEEETRKAMSQARPPEQQRPPTLHEMLPGFAVSVEQLGRVASTLGLGPDLTAGLQAMAETVTKLQQAPQAKPPPPQTAEPPAQEPDQAEPPDIEMEEADMRATLNAAGIPTDESVSAEAATERFKRFQTTYIERGISFIYNFSEGYDVGGVCYTVGKRGTPCIAYLAECGFCFTDGVCFYGVLGSRRYALLTVRRRRASSIEDN